LAIPAHEHMKIKIIPESRQLKRMGIGVLVLFPETSEDHEQLKSLVKKAQHDVVRGERKAVQSVSIMYHSRHR